MIRELLEILLSYLREKAISEDVLTIAFSHNFFSIVCNYLIDAGSENCDAVAIPECEVGYISVRTNPEECVPHYECQCNTTKSPCPKSPICGELEHVVTTEGECCPKQTCGMETYYTVVIKKVK